MYYHCTDYHCGCDNTYIREEQLSTLLGHAVEPIQITPQIAEGIATALRATDQDAEHRRGESGGVLDPETEGLGNGVGDGERRTGTV